MSAKLPEFESQNYQDIQYSFHSLEESISNGYVPTEEEEKWYEEAKELLQPMVETGTIELDEIPF